MAKKDNKISMPQTGAGLVRYFDEESVGPKLAPEHVVVLTIIFLFDYHVNEKNYSLFRL